MEKNEFRGEYLAPEVKVVEIKVQQHILQASTAPDYDRNDW